MISFKDAEKAIRDMNQAMLKTRAIKTNWATRNQNQKRGSLFVYLNTKLYPG